MAQTSSTKTSWLLEGGQGEKESLLRRRAAQRRGDLVPYEIHRPTEGIGRQVGVAGSGRRLAMPEHLADERQGEAGASSEAAEGVSKIVEPDVIETGPLPDPPPGLGEVDQVLALPLAGDDVGVPCDPLRTGE